MLRAVSARFLLLVGGSFLGVPPLALADEPSAYIIGTVSDAQTGEPIPDVHVLIVGTPFGRATDLYGNFVVGPLNHGLCVIEFSHIAYESIRDTLELHPNDTLALDVELARRAIPLDEVRVTATLPRTMQPWKGTSGRVFTRADIEGTGVRSLGDLIRLMSPGASIRELGPDLFIDLYKSSRRTPRSPFRDLQQNNPLIILNGVKIGKSPLALNSLIRTEEIDEIVVLKGLEADMYGYEGRDGVIIIETTPDPPRTGLTFFQKVIYASGVIGAALLISLFLF